MWMPYSAGITRVGDLREAFRQVGDLPGCSSRVAAELVKGGTGFPGSQSVENSMITGVRACSASDPARPGHPSGSGRQPTTQNPWAGGRKATLACLFRLVSGTFHSPDHPSGVPLSAVRTWNCHRCARRIPLPDWTLCDLSKLGAPTGYSGGGCAFADGYRRLLSLPIRAIDRASSAVPGWRRRAHSATGGPTATSADAT